jgi:5,10-methylenetetrahydromethanopterin reductase
MKFGFGLIPSEHPRRHIALIQEAEALGYDFAWIPDQTFFRDPYVLMAAAALNTERIHIGVGVTNPYTRHPAMTARAIATLDELAPGRIHLGIGAGNHKELLHPLGIDGAHAGPKCREMALLVRELLSGEVAHFEGDHFRTVGIEMDFKPRPDIPIYIAGRGPRVLQAAGEVADGVIIGSLCTPPGIAFALEHARAGAGIAGRDLSAIEVVSWVTCQITPDREAALNNLKPLMAHLIGGAPLPVLQAIGLPPEVIDAIKTTYREQGIPQAAEHVTPECIDAFALVGDAEHISRQIQALQGAGVTQLAMLMPPGSIEEQEQRLKQFAEAVFPAFA